MTAPVEQPTREEVPKCKGCGSQKLKAVATASVSVSYFDPLYVEHGELVFAVSDTGFGEGERWAISCEDCGRRMRTSLAPVDVGMIASNTGRSGQWGGA